MVLEVVRDVSAGRHHRPPPFARHVVGRVAHDEQLRERGAQVLFVLAEVLVEARDRADLVPPAAQPLLRRARLARLRARRLNRVERVPKRRERRVAGDAVLGGDLDEGLAALEVAVEGVRDELVVVVARVVGRARLVDVLRRALAVALVVLRVEEGVALLAARRRRAARRLRRRLGVIGCIGERRLWFGLGDSGGELRLHL